jgi:hypothetical protein
MTAGARRVLTQDGHEWQHLKFTDFTGLSRTVKKFSNYLYNNDIVEVDDFSFKIEKYINIKI